MASVTFTYSGGGQSVQLEVTSGFGDPALDIDDVVSIVVDALNAYTPTDLTVIHAGKTVCTEVDLYP